MKGDRRLSKFIHSPWGCHCTWWNIIYRRGSQRWLTSCGRELARNCRELLVDGCCGKALPSTHGLGGQGGRRLSRHSSPRLLSVWIVDLRRPRRVHRVHGPLTITSIVRVFCVNLNLINRCAEPPILA